MTRLHAVRSLISRHAPAALALLVLPVLALAAGADARDLGFLGRVQAHALGIGLSLGGPVALVLAFLVAGRTVPGLVVGRLRRVFDEAKTSPWWRDSTNPHRAKLLLAAVVFLEAEVPNPGEGQAVYDAFGAWANTHARIGAFPLGSAAQWAALARKGGDAIDLELAAEIKELATLTQPTSP